MQQQRPSIRPDTVIAGKYRLLALLAEGGMGAVWRAEDLRLHAPVAVKLMHFPDTQSPEARARFEAEAGIAAQLRSPHVVQVFDVGVDPDLDAPFIAMELLEGECLRDVLARSGPLAPAQVVSIVSQVARALMRAHELGIIHRDLKPANIFLVRDGETELAKVLDFGIAKYPGRAARGRTLTGDLLGTPTYMSPEQLISSKDVDYRSDLWSLGVIAVECLTGKLPFDSDNLPGLALAICQGQCTLPSELGPVPPGFDDWFESATRQQPHERFASAAELAEELRKLCSAAEAMTANDSLREDGSAPRSSSTPEPAPSVGPTSRTLPLDRARNQQRRQRLTAGAALLAALLAAGYALLPRSGANGGAPAQLAAQLPPAVETASQKTSDRVQPESGRGAAASVAASPTPLLVAPAGAVHVLTEEAGAAALSPGVPVKRAAPAHRRPPAAARPGSVGSRAPASADPDNLGF